MLCEDLVKTQNNELNLSVTVRLTNLDTPRSEEQLRDALLAHALECHECLTIVLFEEGSLADCGCETYRKLFVEAAEELLRHTPIDPSAHLTEELLESFFLDRLSDIQMTSMAEHVESCTDCRITLQQRQAFYLCVKVGVQEQKEGRLEQAGLTGVLGVSAPEKGLHFCSRINE